MKKRKKSSRALLFGLILLPYVLVFLGFLVVNWIGHIPLPQPPSRVEPVLPQPDLNFPLQEKWCLRGDPALSLPTYYDGLIYVILEPAKKITPILTPPPTVSRVAAYDLQGKLVWAKEVVTNYVLGQPGYWFFSSGYLALVDDRSVMVLDSKTGEEIWSQPVFVNTGMAIGDGKVFWSTYEYVAAFDLKTGQQVWKIPGQGRHHAAPIYFENGDRKILLIDQDTYRLADALTGIVFYETKSTINLGYPQQNLSIVHGDQYIRPTRLGFEVLDVWTGKIIKNFEGSGSLFHQPIKLKEQFILLNTPSSISVLDLAQMKSAWQVTFDDETSEKGLKVYSNPFEFQGNVYVILSDASIRAFDLQNGTEVGRWQAKKVENKLGDLTSFIPGFDSGEGMLFASFGTNEVCAFR
jgi:outer membrane protein assembly factor BamB